MARDVAIDCIRGVAVFSMISGHFAAGSYLAKPTHSIPYFDGASAFVLVSGLVLGIVHSRWSHINSRGRLLRRIWVIYLCQFFICLTAAIVSLCSGDHSGLRPLAGWGEAMWRSLALQYMPAGGDILALYFVLMIGAAGIIELLRRGKWLVIIVGSVLLYIFAQTIAQEWMYIPNYSELGHIANWASWQVLFVPAIAVGWNWQSWNVAKNLDRMLIPLIALSFAVAVSSNLVSRSGWFPGVNDMLADKVDMGVGRVCSAWLLTVAVYALFRRIGRVRVLRPIESTGARSLDSYVLQAVLLLIVPLLVARPWGEVTATAIAVSVFACAWAWAEARKYLGIDRLHRTPTVLIVRAKQRFVDRQERMSRTRV